MTTCLTQDLRVGVFLRLRPSHKRCGLLSTRHRIVLLSRNRQHGDLRRPQAARVQLSLFATATIAPRRHAVHSGLPVLLRTEATGSKDPVAVPRSRRQSLFPVRHLSPMRCRLPRTRRGRSDCHPHKHLFHAVWSYVLFLSSLSFVCQAKSHVGGRSF